MLGERSEQKGLGEADHLYLDVVGRDAFNGLLASLRGQLFRDADFAELCCPDNGRASVAPSLLATALLLQVHDTVSDVYAKLRAHRRSGGTALPAAQPVLTPRSSIENPPCPATVDGKPRVRPRPRR